MAQILFQQGQSPTGYTGAYDCTLDEIKPTTNFDGSPLSVKSSPSGISSVSILSFDISLIPNSAIIDTAVLRLHFKSATSSATTIRVFNMLLGADWDSTLCDWNTYNGSKDWSEYGARYNTKDIDGDWSDTGDDPAMLCKFSITGSEAAFSSKTSVNNSNLITLVQNEINTSDVVYFALHENINDDINIVFEDAQNTDSAKYNPELIITYHINATVLASCRTASFSLPSSNRLISSTYRANPLLVNSSMQTINKSISVLSSALSMSSDFTVDVSGQEVNRLYFQSLEAADVTPSYSAEWHSVALAEAPLKMFNKKQSSSMVTSTNISADIVAGDRYMLARQWVSSELKKQTISGNVRGQMRCRESHANLNAYLAITIRVVSNDGTVERGTLIAISAGLHTLGAEMTISATLQNRPFEEDLIP